MYENITMGRPDNPDGTNPTASRLGVKVKSEIHELFVADKYMNNGKLTGKLCKANWERDSFDYDRIQTLYIPTELYGP